MKQPPYLKKGDKIAITAPAGKIDPDKVKIAKTTLEKSGYQVILGKYLFKVSFQFSAPDNDRLSDFQQMLDNPEIKVILCARGGYGTIRIIDQLDFTNFKKNPKWIAGFSDITVLHSHIHSNFNIQTVHGIMTTGFDTGVSSNESITTFLKALTGELQRYEIQRHYLSKEGKASGLLTGGNLAILVSLLGSVSDIDTKDKILFIEDVGEYLYRLDRMIITLKRAGKLSRLAALIVGGMTDMKTGDAPFGKTAYEIISEAIQEFDYPVLFGFPAGHQKDNRALILGREVKVEVTGDKSFLEFS